MSDRTINVGIIGFGFMGRTHGKAYQDAANDGYACKLIAVADANLKDLDSYTGGNIDTDQQSIDTSNITLYNDAERIIKDPGIHLISVCTHTETHVDLAIAALEAGKHVLVEKPIAIDPDDVQRLASAAEGSDRLCIPAMCMRHWPAWVKIREIIRSKEHGSVRSAVFNRLGSRPTWATDFYTDQSRSGGVLHDLHIHDTDFIFHCFGKPSAVITTGDDLHLTTIYEYNDIPHVTAQGAWDHQPTVGYQMKCTIAFEHATLDFDLDREPQLILFESESSTPIETDQRTGYDHEIRWALDQIRGNKRDLQPMHDAVQVARVLECEQQSIAARSGVSVD